MHFLFKEEPTNYSYDAFAKDGKATWTGVKNPVAQRNLRGVSATDREGGKNGSVERQFAHTVRDYARSGTAP